MGGHPFGSLGPIFRLFRFFFENRIRGLARLLGSIESLKRDQKVIARQGMTLTDAVKNSIDKSKKKKVDENAALDFKLRDLEIRCETDMAN